MLKPMYNREDNEQGADAIAKKRKQVPIFDGY